MGFFSELDSLQSTYLEYLSGKYGVKRQHLVNPDDYLMENVIPTDSKDYSHISEEELLEAFDSSFEQSFQDEDYIWRSDISPRDLEELIDYSTSFSAARKSDAETDRYGFVIEGGLQHVPLEDIDLEDSSGIFDLVEIDTRPLVLTGTVYEPESLFDCKTRFRTS